LKRLNDALGDKDPILGVINGIATNHSAEAVSITHPHAGAQKFLFQKVMDEAEVDIRSFNYVEMHGTVLKPVSASRWTLSHQSSPPH
jgi:acyl transferase domain-containing protein